MRETFHIPSLLLYIRTIKQWQACVCVCVCVCVSVSVCVCVCPAGEQFSPLKLLVLHTSHTQYECVIL